MNDHSLPKPFPSCEFLTVEELGQRLQVSRATVFSWMQKGIFTQGRHYFRRGRVLRFIWSGELIQELLAGSSEKVESVKPSLTPVRQIKSSPINWEY